MTPLCRRFVLAACAAGTRRAAGADDAVILRRWSGRAATCRSVWPRGQVFLGDVIRWR